MKRREFITLIGGAAACPFAAHAQQPMPVIGFLDSSRSPGDAAFLVSAFGEGLNEVGYVEGQNVVIEYRWAEGQYDRLPVLAAELVRRQVTVIYASSLADALAAKAATTTIPIVFIATGDPIQLGLVASFTRPGANGRGVNQFSAALEQKKLELLHEFVPKAGVIGVFVNPTYPTAETISKDLQVATRTLGVQIHVVNASDESGIDTAFATLVEQRVGALLVTAGPFFSGRGPQLLAPAAAPRGSPLLPPPQAV